ncbi:MAG: succinate dehydrogenase assembly factor 2 [Burkholderiaceae bacterium]
MGGKPGGPLDAARLRRLRWRARRGLLENDIVLERFFDTFGERLSESDVEGLDILLDLPDNELLDLILKRVEPQGAAAGSSARRVLERLQSV